MCLWFYHIFHIFVPLFLQARAMPTTPHTRNTRSNSIPNTKSNLASERNQNLDLKATLDEFRNEIVSALKSELRTEIKYVMNKLDSLEHRLSSFENTIAKLQNVQERQAQELHQLRENIQQTDPETLIKETVLRIKKRDYLIVSGIPELAQGCIEERRLHDLENIQELGQVLGCDLVPEEVRRVGSINSSIPDLSGLNVVQETLVTLCLKGRRI